MVTIGPQHIELPLDEIAAICRRYPVRELAVFGSALRDDFREDSDIDLLVELDPNVTFGLFGFFDLSDDLSTALGRPVDRVSKNGLHWAIRDSVLESTMVIYEG
jgi:predicted nucleotidyltransferase